MHQTLWGRKSPADLGIPKLSLAKEKSHEEDQTKHNQNADTDEG